MRSPIPPADRCCMGWIMTNLVGLENAERDAEDIMEAVPDKKTEGVS